MSGLGSQQRSGGASGQSTIEFALIVIPFFLLLVGMFDLGRAVYQFHLLSNAVREAARFGIAGRAPEDICRVAVQKTFAPGAALGGCAAGATEGGVWSTAAGALAVEIIAGTSGDPSAPLEVRLAYPFRLVTPLISNIAGSTLTLRAASTMYREVAVPTPNPLTPSPTPNRTPTPGAASTATRTPTPVTSPTGAPTSTSTPTPSSTPTATTVPVTTVKTWDFETSAENWIASAGSASTMSWTGADGSPAGSLQARIAGRNKADTNVWSIDQTWQQLGVPAGKTVTSVQLVAVRQKTSELLLGGANTWSVELRNTAGVQQAVLLSPQSEILPELFWPGDLGGATQGVPLGLRPSATAVRLAIVAQMATANSTLAAVAMRWDHISLAITYV